MVFINGQPETLLDILSELYYLDDMGRPCSLKEDRSSTTHFATRIINSCFYPKALEQQKTENLINNEIPF